MKSLATLILLLGILPFGVEANANGLSDLKSWPVYLAAEQCHQVTLHCATEFQVHGDAAHQARSSCHNVDKAVDIFGSRACLNSWAVCLSALPTNWVSPTLYCYAYGGVIGTGLNIFDSRKCNRADHTDHIHLQPMFGCSNSGQRGED